MGKSFEPIRADGDVWHYGDEDVKGRWGWIAEAGVKGEITFPVETVSGRIIVEYLGTYENIGTATCWLDQELSSTCPLDGFWSHRFSQPKMSIMKADGPPGKHNL